MKNAYYLATNTALRSIYSLVYSDSDYYNESCFGGWIMYLHRKLLGSRRKKILYILAILIFCTCVWWFLYVTEQVSNEPYLKHFRRNRNLSYYMKSISLLAEPTTTACDSLGDVPLLILVASGPDRYEYRDVIRTTWGPHFPTYFLLGLKNEVTDTNVQLEAQQYNDMIIYEFQDHYQNLTLKTALMLRWTQDRCPSIGFLMKTDDDILVNPWIMKNILKQHNDAKMIGYKVYNVAMYRSEYGKWYLPRWLFKQDTVPEYLLGAGYLINGKYVERMLDAAVEVPLINIEDIYFTYLVAKSQLGLELTHDLRLKFFRRWLHSPCVYWPYAISHDLSTQSAVEMWRGLAEIGKDYENNKEFCPFYNNLVTLFKFVFM